MMARCVSCRAGIVLLVLTMAALLSLASASRHILQSDKLTPLDISKDEGSQGGVEAVRYATTGEESEREVPTGPDPIHHHGVPKTRSAFLPKTWPFSNTMKKVADQNP